MYTSFFKKLIKTWMKEIYMDIILVDLYLKKSVVTRQIKKNAIINA